MFIKKIPSPDQSLIRASSRINTYKKAFEELIYNALDANSTSIAIRVNIEHNSIQVIDNGCGITKKDLDVTGQRYMTSKYDDKSNAKFDSNKYGYGGESLANIVEVSKTVRITSRHESSDETWEKCFRNSKFENIVEVVKRPSKGTTIEIKGLFYNITFQYKSFNHLNENQEIKLCLEGIALVHSNISLSLRDDSRNEIVFQLHKQRDIHQTISHLYDISELEIQELKVEKNQYAVTAYIAKEHKDIKKVWIFLNRKYINNNSRLHKIINDNLNKCLNNKYHRKKSLIKYNNEDQYFFENKLPFYCLFIQCPVKDYDIIDKLVEFNNWDQITRLLEKVIHLYISDVHLQPVTDDKEYNKDVDEDTRGQVKKIINKILASTSNMLGVSQIQNGIKGKISKRKRKKKQKPHLKLIQMKCTIEQSKQPDKEPEAHIDLGKKNIYQPKTIIGNKKRDIKNKLSEERLNKSKKEYGNTNQHNIKRNHTDISKDIILKKNSQGVYDKKVHINLKTKSKTQRKTNEFINDSVIKRFINPTNSIKHRCETLAQKAQEALNNFNIKSATHVDKSAQYSYKGEHTKGIYIHKNTEYKHHYDKIYLEQIKNVQHKMKREYNNITSNYDLLNTMLNTQANSRGIDADPEAVPCSKNKVSNYESKTHYSPFKVTNASPVVSKLTYESHNNELIRYNKTLKSKKPNNIKFMSTKSKDNFITSHDIENLKIWQRKCTYSRRLKERQKPFLKNITHNNAGSVTCNALQNIEEYSEIIEFPKNNNKNNTVELINAYLSNCTLTNYQTQNMSLFIKNSYQNISDNMDVILDTTFDLPKDCNINNEHSVHLQELLNFNAVSGYTLNGGNRNIDRSDCLFTEGNNGTHDSNETNIKDNIETADIRDQHFSILNTRDTQYAPMDVCEAVFLSKSTFEKEFQNIFINDNQKYLNISANTKEVLCDVNKDNEIYNTQNSIECTSQHFSNINKLLNSLRSNIETDDKAKTAYLPDKEQKTDPVPDNIHTDLLIDTNHNEKCEIIDFNTFDLKNRFKFVPKGMSPIFKNCNTKQTCSYNLDSDYYQDNLYDNFLNEVETHSEVYKEQLMQVYQEKDMKNKCKNRTTDFSLSFDNKSLECAKVLKQIDCKFIATVLRNTRKDNGESSNFLVLFDQHAVHERIRLETNLSEYVTNGQWKSVSIDNTTLLLSKDEIIYLHNYKEKFTQLGLQWTMSSNNAITITGIPEAILGKNPRQVDKIIKAIRNMIAEQISNIKTQNGCISVYPKSIMDLVHSEACRYAVMFGDKLEKECCEELLKSLSKCNKPFQCAHGRPVMAVLTDFEYKKQEYKANFAKLKRFK